LTVSFTRFVAPRGALGLIALLAMIACGDPESASLPDASIRFVRDGREVATRTARELASVSPARVVTTDDPYYGRHKRFRAIELGPVLAHAFGRDIASLARESFVLRATDGYAVPIAGSRLLEGGAFIAFDDVDVPGFAPIGPRRVSPAPAYLVWTRRGQSNLETHPRPWQLATIEIARFETLYPHTIPTGEPTDSPAMRGLGLFQDHCIRCHAINREGGRVGPDLNVPRSIVEYRPEPQIRDYIRNPRSFRYGAMPAHPHLSESDLDALLAYLRAMASRKYDPHSAEDQGPG